jgi:uncharacterized protein DUF4189
VDRRRDDVSTRGAALIALLALGALCASPAAARDEPRRGSAIFGAIAYHPESGSVGWATDRKTSREAKVEALRQCGHEKCEVMASVSRGCAALARSTKKHSVQNGVTRQEAEAKALRRCGEQCEIAAWTCTR